MNVIGSRPDGWWRDRDGAKRRLVERLEAWAEEGGEEVAVVFDGRPVKVAARAVEVAFAPGGPHAAADAIVAWLAAAEVPSAIRVVTSDRLLAGRARAAGAEVVGARSLWSLMES